MHPTATHTPSTPTATHIPPPPGPALCVLASGSAGNCTLLRTERSTLLLDAGLSPRRTRALLAPMGLGLADLDGVLLTHLDGDHCHAGWARALPEGVPVHLHRRHLPQARRRGLPARALAPFEVALEPGPDWCAFPLMADHDSTGTVCYRFELNCGAGLGLATDLGRPTEALAEHLAGVDVLALESNYCPRMQAESDRPDFLKRRVTGGAGHLSNQQAAALARRVGPRAHVVLLHLSRQCNTPDLAAAPHAGAPYALTVSDQRRPTPWIALGRAPGRTAAPAMAG